MNQRLADQGLRDAAWVAMAVGEDPQGKTPSEIIGAAKAHIPSHRAVEGLAWLENRGYAIYDRDKKRWRLTSLGRKLAQA